MSPLLFMGLSFLLFFVPLLGESVTSWIAIVTARKRFPELWEHSGCPTLMGNGNLTKAWPLVKYYRDRDYLEVVGHGAALRGPVGDPEAIAFAEKLRGPLVWTYWSAWLGIGLFFLVYIGGGIVFF